MQFDSWDQRLIKPARLQGSVFSWMVTFHAEQEGTDTDTTTNKTHCSASFLLCLIMDSAKFLSNRV